MRQKFGIYKIACKNCDQIYIGQIKKSTEIICKEHVASFNFGKARLGGHLILKIFTYSVNDDDPHGIETRVKGDLETHF